jgi:PTS system nitrogen regulatory IIA component
VPDSILTIKQLADYLMVSEKTVYRMLDRNQIPAIRVGAQWRFRQGDIDAWLSEEVRRVEFEGKRAALADESSDIAIAPLLAPENVWLSVAPASRDDLIRFMIGEASLDPHVDRDHLVRSILEREAICSTAVLESAAFPHPTEARTFRFSKKRVLLAVLRDRIDFSDPHGHKPRIVGVILARSVQGQLLALSRAIKLFAYPALVEKLASAESAGEAIRVIADAEKELAR